MISPEFLHYGAAIAGISLGAIGAGIGLGIAAFGIQESMMRQPTGNSESFRAMIIGLALIESGVIIALVTTLLTLMSGMHNTSWEVAFAELGIGLAVGVSAATISVASSFVVKAAAEAIARQPLFSGKILIFMLIAQSIIEAPVIFAFIVAILVRLQLSPALQLAQSLKLFSSTFVIALGCIGPSIGQAIFAYSACKAIGLNKNAYNKIFPYSLLTEAIIETPMIFCLLVSLLILYSPVLDVAVMMPAIKYFFAALTLGMGSLGGAIGIGYVSAKSCYYLALQPGAYNYIIRSTLLAIAFIESSIIYALIIAILLVTRL